MEEGSWPGKGKRKSIDNRREDLQDYRVRCLLGEWQMNIMKVVQIIKRAPFYEQPGKVVII